MRTDVWQNIFKPRKYKRKHVAEFANIGEFQVKMRLMVVFFFSLVVLINSIHNFLLVDAVLILFVILRLGEKLLEST